VIHPKTIFTRRIGTFSGLLPILLAACLPAAAQLSPAPPDPLARIRAAAKGNTEACSATGETLCEQVAPKVIANAQGDSPLAGNIQRLNDDLKGVAGSEAAARVVSWAVAAFRDAGLDVHTEKFADPKSSPAELGNVVAEIRGREKPDEWVLVGAPLDTSPNSESSCDAASVIEAARDIQRTGILPRRSIRFVLFTGNGKGVQGSWAYVRSHREELDRARAAIVLGSKCLRVTGYGMNGRRDIEPGLREAMKPVESLGAGNYVFGARLGTDNYDFLVEGVPTLTAIQVPASDRLDSPATPGMPDKINIADLKRNTAIVAVTAFGIAERAAPIGPRQSRSQIKSLLETSGLERDMKGTGLWPLWESGERGRLP
jgi:hypothetical protein